MAVRSLLAANSELAAGLAALGYRCSERSAIGGGAGQVLVAPVPAAIPTKSGKPEAAAVMAGF